MVTAKIAAEISALANHLYDWHAGRTSQRHWRFAAGACANAVEISRLETIDKYSYAGVAGLREKVAAKYLER